MVSLKLNELTGGGNIEIGGEALTTPIQLMVLLYLKPTEGSVRYAGLLLAPAEGFGQGRGLLCPLGKKKSFYICFVQNVGHFW